MSTPRETDVEVTASAQMHSEVYPDDERASEVLPRSERTCRRYRTEGSKGGIPHETLKYARHAENSFRLEAEIAAARKVRQMDMNDAELIERYWQLRELEKAIEGEDNQLDVQRPSAWQWMEKAHVKKRDAAVETELAAVYTQFAMRGIAWREVVEAQP